MMSESVRELKLFMNSKLPLMTSWLFVNIRSGDEMNQLVEPLAEGINVEYYCQCRFVE